MKASGRSSGGCSRLWSELQDGPNHWLQPLGAMRGRRLREATYVEELGEDVCMLVTEGTGQQSWHWSVT